MIELERNLGGASSRNQGLAVSCGEFIAAMDCDDLSLPQRLQKQVDFLRRNPDIAVLGTGVQAASEELHPLFNFDLPQAAPALIVLNLFVGSFFIHPSIMMRREALTADWRIRIRPGRRQLIPSCGRD